MITGERNFRNAHKSNYCIINEDTGLFAMITKI
jgi:hypothetical protein